MNMRVSHINTIRRSMNICSRHRCPSRDRSTKLIRDVVLSLTESSSHLRKFQPRCYPQSLMKADLSTSRIFGWEVLPGLPGDGPVPLHFHPGHPTPWKEGLVIRFWNEDGTEWVGNFQGCSGRAEALLWPEASAVAVDAGDFFYLIDANDPGSYTTLGSEYIANAMVLDEHRNVLVVAAGYGLRAFDLNRNRLWDKGSGGFIRRIIGCEGTTVTVEIEDEDGGPLARPSEIVQISIEEESVDDRRYLERLFATLDSHPEVDRMEPGLSDAEVQALERQFKFMFPPDLRSLLRFMIPVGSHFPNWRGDPAVLQDRFDWPFEGICFDVEHSRFWLQEWDLKPANAQARREIVGHAVADVPRLIPIYSHRYIPSAPSSEGNPVFSVYQTDIIYYGNDLADYFHKEFGVPLPTWAARTPTPILFWDELLKLNNG